MARYLADTSIWSWANKRVRPDIATKLLGRLSRESVVTCVPVALELMHRADSSRGYRQLFDDLFEPLEWLATNEAASRRALEVQQALAAVSDGAHRRSPVDFFVAAVAELHEDVVLWAFDDDFRIIADVTGQPVELEAAV